MDWIFVHDWSRLAAWTGRIGAVSVIALLFAAPDFAWEGFWGWPAVLCGVVWAFAEILYAVAKAKDGNAHRE